MAGAGRAGDNAPIAGIGRDRPAVCRGEADKRVFAGQDRTVRVGSHRGILLGGDWPPMLMDAARRGKLSHSTASGSSPPRGRGGERSEPEGAEWAVACRATPSRFLVRFGPCEHAPSTMLRMVPRPRSAGEEPQR